MESLSACMMSGAKRKTLVYTPPPVIRVVSPAALKKVSPPRVLRRQKKRGVSASRLSLSAVSRAVTRRSSAPSDQVPQAVSVTAT
ncbi:hypothetical protein BJQ90_02347 [Arthrobacter sp. SO3]|nr:hypothetical protein [Arthrobacter sp. SO3]